MFWVIAGLHALSFFASVVVVPRTKRAHTMHHILAQVGVYGPGHHTIWDDRITNKTWAFYHAKKSREVGWERFICVDELLMDAESGELTLNVTLGSRN